MSLRVSNDEANELVSMAVDTVTDYVQAPSRALPTPRIKTTSP